MKSDFGTPTWRCVPLLLVVGQNLIINLGTAGTAFAAPASSAATQQVTFEIPAGPVASALNLWAERAGLKLLAPTETLRNINTRGVVGSFTPSQALARLLAGTGLTYRFNSPTTVTIDRVPVSGGVTADAAGGLTLDTINVQGQSESGVGPVQGIVAHQSVTGTKTDTPLLETPQSISVISRDQIELQQAVTLGETLRYTPGVLAEVTGGTDLRIDQYLIRGFQNTMPFLDGLSTNGHYTLLSTNIDYYGAERISVLHGPASMLYGQNIPGGIVDVISKRPLDTPYHKVELQAGSYGRIQGAFDLTGPVEPDGTLLYRLVGVARRSGTQVDDVDSKRLYIAPSMTWKPDADTSITVLGHVQHSDDGFEAQNLPAIGTLYPSSFGQIPTNRFLGEPNFNNVTRDEYAIGYTAEHRFNSVFTLRQNLRYTYLDTSVKYIGGSGLEAGTSVMNRFSLAAQAYQTNFAVDTQGQFNFDTWVLQHTALVGIDYYRSHDRWVENDGSAAPINVIAPVYGQGFTVPAPDFATSDTLAQVGAYGQDQIRWNHFTFTGGLRHDWADTTVVNLIKESRTPEHNEALTGRAGLTYQFDTGIAPYVSYATSFQPQVGTTFAGTPFLPTEGEQIEGGVKYQPVGYNAMITLAGYNLVENNVSTTDPDHPLMSVQTGAIRVRGFEASLVADLSEGWKAIASYTYMDGAITKANDGTVGNRPLDVPGNMANLFLDKTFNGGPLDGFGVNGGVRYVGQRFGDNANTLSIPADVFFDAGIHYQYAGWRFSLTAKNLFDKVYVATCTSANFCYYGERREVVGTISFRW